MAYNLLNYPDASANAADTALRNPHYRTILSSSNPDILVVEEMNSQFGVNVFLSNVLNATTLSMLQELFWMVRIRIMEYFSSPRNFHSMVTEPYKRTSGQLVNLHLCIVCRAIHFVFMQCI
ncbi:MAG: hypothetical protein IPF81_03500 [Bacteroidetes bacterium]|nr:hypothetical protein [Bacteroidota bacterium]